MWTSTFMPMLRGQWYRRLGHAVDGSDQYATGAPLRYTPVTAYANQEPSSIRTDKSGSKSRANEITFDVRIMVHPESKVRIGDAIDTDEGRYRVVGVSPRRSMHGIIHHYQVDLNV